MITNQQTFNDIVKVYDSIFPHEQKRQEFFYDFIKGNETYHGLADRSKMPAHITASSIVVSRTTGKVLFVFKPALNNHFQPGGHIKESDASPLHAAIRHLTWRLPRKFVNRLTYLQWHYDPLVPMDIDTHKIPASPEDGEPAHYHFDLRYLFLGDESMLSRDDEMYRKHQPIWKDIEEVYAINSFHELIPKLNIAQTPELARKRFYSEVTQGIKRKSTAVIAVAHIIPDVVDYLMTLNRVFDLRGVIAKPKSINKTVKDFLIQNGIPVVLHDRESDDFEQYLDTEIENSKLPVVLIDIGGWFAKLTPHLSKKHGKKLVGIVEDTENGLQKYEKIQNLNLPVYSVARSPLKDFEDYLIGKSIVYSADALLRSQGHLIEYFKTAILGYGKIGKSIAFELASRGLQPSVYDQNPIRRLEAYNRVFNLPTWSDIISKSDIIFSATGGKATNLIDFNLLKSGSFLFSVTSADDEFDFNLLKKEFEITKVDDYLEKCTGKTNYFYLFCNGNAVNFVHGACVGDFIQLVRSEMLCAVDLLINSEHQAGIHITKENLRKSIANTWLRTFLRINDLLFEKDRDKALLDFIASLDNIILI